MGRVIKLCFVNLLVGVAMLGSLLVLSAGLQDLLTLLPPRGSPKAKLPVYADTPWAETFFKEFSELNTKYADFIGWRRRAFSGSTITVNDEGFRIAPDGPKDPGQAAIHMFGGSTMWGTGSDDASTIPATLQRVTGRTTFNFGESAYVSHQSLNLLLRNYAMGYKPQTVIFYDGVNEVAHKCRSEISFFGTSQEQWLTNITAPNHLWRLIVVGLELKRLSSVSDPYDCDTNPEKARRIADTLVLDWQVAKLVAEAHGAKFIPVLQPVSYIGNPVIDYLPDLEARLGQQYAVMYPLFRKQLAAAGIDYIDLTAIFDDGPARYIDFCHVIPAGNEAIAERLARIIEAGKNPD